MSNSDIPGNHQEPSKRFRRILKTSEEEDIAIPNSGETNADTKIPPEVRSDSVDDVTDLGPQPEASSDEPAEKPSNGVNDGSSQEPVETPQTDNVIEDIVSLPASQAKTQQTVLEIDEYGMPVLGRINRGSNQPDPNRLTPVNKIQSHKHKHQRRSLLNVKHPFA